MLMLALLLQAGPDSALVAAALRAEVAGDSTLLVHYTAREWRPTWFADGRLTAPGARVRQALERATDRGLEPTDYPSTSLTPDELAVAGHNVDWLAALDAGLSGDAVRFGRALATGRLDPRTIMPAARIDPDRRFDAAATLSRLLAAPDPSAVFDTLEPSDPGYRKLREALPTLRNLATRIPPFPDSLLPGILRSGDPFLGVDRLLAHLRLLGDTAAGERRGGADGRYDGEGVEAVRRFQSRHGLEPDGIIGPATRAALATPIAWRVRQVELALERWRWFGDAGPGPLVDVDVAAAMLRHRDRGLGEDPLTSRVIVGNADWSTPQLQSTIVRVILNPEWIVPTSIAHGELLPQFRDDSTLFARDGYELRRNGAVLPPTAENLAAVGRGVILRQRPGPRNALGRIKLEIAGTSAIHLHDTPGRHLFADADRWLSHGCVRVERIEGLARRLLAGDVRWPPERITAALADTVSVTVVLREPVPVRLRYATAAIDDQGALVFRPDRYDRDRRLDEALRNGGR